MPEFPETNQSLIARVKDLADGASWVEFLGIYQPVVLRMAKRRGLQDADSQDSEHNHALQGTLSPGRPESESRQWDAESENPRSEIPSVGVVREILFPHDQDHEKEKSHGTQQNVCEHSRSS